MSVMTWDGVDTSVLLTHLERIADALEVIAGDITERKQAAAASLVSQYRYLVAEADRAAAAFGSADAAAFRRAPGTATDNDREYLQRMEREADAAHGAYQAFRAAHPEIEAIIAAERAAMPATCEGCGEVLTAIEAMARLDYCKRCQS